LIPVLVAAIPHITCGIQHLLVGIRNLMSEIWQFTYTVRPNSRLHPEAPFMTLNAQKLISVLLGSLQLVSKGADCTNN